MVDSELTSIGKSTKQSAPTFSTANFTDSG